MWNLNDAYEQSGTNLTLIRMLKDLHISKPDNYLKSDIEEILTQYAPDENIIAPDVNVIVIMNESFTDYTNNENLNIKQDNLPYYHKLINSENVISGIMHSSAFGGATANVEYEFLTQNTIAFLPTDLMPYQQ